MLGVGASKKTYMDDVFSTFLYTGTGSSGNSINNGIDLSGEGGLVWLKRRNSSTAGRLFDTERGGTKYSVPSDDTAQVTTGNTGFNNNGFTVNETWLDINYNTVPYASWSFRKAPGFFDVVTWNGNSVNGRQIAHNLGCVPGLIMIKATINASGSMGNRGWQVYHRDIAVNQALELNTNLAVVSSDAFGGARPTATHFTVSNNYPVNYSGATYVAYLFAGGESTAATARSVFFDGDDDRLTFSATSDFSFGTGDFTMECWAKREEDNDSYSRLIHFGPYWNSDSAFGIIFDDGDHSDKLTFASYRAANQGTVGSAGRILISKSDVYSGVWYHVAVTRSSGVYRLFINGTLEDKNSSITSLTLEGSNTSTNTLAIAGTVDRMTGEALDGNISNVRVIKGTALYTESFKPPTEPLTNVTNTKLLCCNNSSTTGSTVTPGTIVADGAPIAKTYSPFDDPDNFKFGENGDQNVIKTGSYIGNGNADGTEVYLGWEPQWLLIKNVDSAADWLLFDCMRGIASGGNDPYLVTSGVGAEDSGSDWLELTSTGFKIARDHAAINSNNQEYVYMCVRRPDGYVSKLPELGSEVFSLNSGSNSGAPLFDSTHVVDYQFVRKITATWNWESGARILGSKQVYLNTNGTETDIDSTGWKYDYMNGWHSGASGTSNYMCWMWKRYAGMDVVSTKGAAVGYNTIGKMVPHSLGRVPEMYWIKRRNGSTGNWAVYHKGLNGGTNPEQYGFDLNGSGVEDDQNGFFADTAPTATHFSLGLWGSTGISANDYLIMLFASVPGVSKVGYYDGSSSSQTITTGFQPRFLIIKGTTVASDWFILDTTRGWASGNDTYLMIDADSAQASDTDFGAPTSTGFTLTSGNTWNSSGNKFIYYAHA